MHQIKTMSAIQSISYQNVICPSCEEWPCTQLYTDCQTNLTIICDGCGNCPCTKTFEDCYSESEDD